MFAKAPVQFITSRSTYCIFTSLINGWTLNKFLPSQGKSLPHPISAGLCWSRLLPREITGMLDKQAYNVSFFSCQVKFSGIRIDIKGISEKVMILSHHLDQAL